ncbi:MAG: hypothetical protein FWG05_01515 [Kiritimatiellaeota bacterium]|nr:hypothetical protein [Kiritimatiellota bacterium]
MTSKQRVANAIARKPVDRVPVFMWFHPETVTRLAETLEIAPRHVASVMGNDVFQTWVGNNHAMEGVQHEHDGERHTDDWGITWERQYGFNQIVNHPLANATDDEIDRYEFPHDRIPALLKNMDAMTPFQDTHFIGCDVSPCALELMYRIFGMERAMLELACDTPAIRRFIGKTADFGVALSVAACAHCHMDWLWTGDDVGGQHGMILSPEMWRETIRPAMARIVDVGRQSGLPVAYHSCGAIRPIIPDLIEIGVNVLNPIQCDCPGMVAASLKAEFGKHLTFMGGVDTINLLPRGSVSDVRRATRALIDTMTSDGGGFILAASHTIAPETPMENIFAMYHEAGLTKEMIFDAASELRRHL